MCGPRQFGDPPLYEMLLKLCTAVLRDACTAKSRSARRPSMSFCQRDVMVTGAPLSERDHRMRKAVQPDRLGGGEQLAGIDQERGAIGKPRRDGDGDVADAAAIDANTWESHAA